MDFITDLKSFVQTIDLIEERDQVRKEYLNIHKVDNFMYIPEVRQHHKHIMATTRTKEWNQKIAKSNSKPKDEKGRLACIANSKIGADKWRGCKHTEETKRKIGESQKGKWVDPTLTMKEYLIEGKVFLSRKAVAEEYGITVTTVHNRVKSEKFPDWSLHGTT